MNQPSQLDFISKYIDNSREHYNPELFKRDENEIIEELKKVILSCQRNKKFIIRVDGFEVVDDYGEIYRILEQYEEINSRSKAKHKKDRINQFSYINLKDSDIKLLIVKYYLKAKNPKNKKEEMEENLTVLIAVPRYVNKYYFRISGNYYSAMWQIVDGSTYNNLTSNNSSVPKITLKGYMPPIQLFKNIIKLNDWKIDEVDSVIYIVYTFNQSFPAILYIMAKYGFYKGLNFLGVGNIFSVNKNPIEREDFYNFKAKNYFVSIPKMMFDKNEMCQNIAASLVHYVEKAKKYEDIFSLNFWQWCLGGEYLKTGTVEKGRSLLDSIESIYDVGIQEIIKLPEEDKKDVYCILKWMMREFNELIARSNLDIGYKCIRMGKYIASIYNMKICNALYSRISGKREDITISDLKKVVKIAPMYLLQNITKCNLVNYRDLVNDLDAIVATSYTTKRVASITGPQHKGGGPKQPKKENKMPKPYRYIHPSHMGRIDIDSSHKSDPGASGNLCPMVKLYDRYFSNYTEPNEWEKEFDKLLDKYKEMRGLKSLFIYKDELGVKTDNEIKENVDDGLNHLKKMIPLFVAIDKEKDDEKVYSIKIPLEASGTITYEGGRK